MMISIIFRQCVNYSYEQHVVIEIVLCNSDMPVGDYHHDYTTQKEYQDNPLKVGKYRINYLTIVGLAACHIIFNLRDVIIAANVLHHLLQGHEKETKITSYHQDVVVLLIGTFVLLSRF